MAPDGTQKLLEPRRRNAGTLQKRSPVRNANPGRRGLEWSPFLADLLHYARHLMLGTRQGWTAKRPPGNEHPELADNSSGFYPDQAPHRAENRWNRDLNIWQGRPGGDESAQGSIERSWSVDGAGAWVSPQFFPPHNPEKKLRAMGPPPPRHAVSRPVIHFENFFAVN